VAATNAYHARVIEPSRNALGVIRLNAQMLGNGIDGHIALDAVTRKVADRPQEGTLVGHGLLM
jgi:hypothetical protein